MLTKRTWTRLNLIIKKKNHDVLNGLTGLRVFTLSKHRTMDYIETAIVLKGEDKADDHKISSSVSH